MGSRSSAAGERRLVTWTVWPSQLQLFTAAADVRPARDICAANPKALRIYRSPKLGRAVRCESQLEERFFELLDSSEIVETYCEQPMRIPYPDGRFPHYFPDVQIALKDRRRILAEVKDSADLADYQNFRKWIALFNFGHGPGFGIFIGNQETSLPEALLLPLQPALLEAIASLAAGKQGVTQDHMHLLHRRFDFGDKDLAAAALQLGLYMSRHPFELRTPKDQEQVLIAKLRAAFGAYVRDLLALDNTTVPVLAKRVTGVATTGGPSWFAEDGWTYEALTAGSCPECRDRLHALRKPWQAPGGRTERAWAIVCPTCATARTMESLPDDVRQLIRAA